MRLTALQPLLDLQVPLIFSSQRQRANQPIELVAMAFLRKPHTTLTLIRAAVMEISFVSDRPRLF